MSLSKLRTNPDVTITECGFIVDNKLYTSNDQGGVCVLKGTLIDKTNKIFQLEPTSGMGDFFYPYRQQVGSCSVPIGRSDGAIVLTGGMNGCSLAVYKNGGNFDFYHDTNDTYLASRNPAGTKVCFVPNSSYAGPLEVGRKKATDLTNEKQKVYFQHTLITVHLADKWQVFVSGVLSFYDTKGKIFKYEKFVPTVSNLITSFEDR
jgi:hypothetical protein